MREVYIIRHGQSEANKTNIVQGCIIDTPLTDEGVRQAERLRAHFPVERLDKLVASPLKRALQTAQILQAGMDVPLQSDERIREMSYGRWEGTDGKQLHQEHPDLFMSTGQVKSVLDQYADGESFADVEARVAAFWDDLGKDNSWTSVGIVCHGFISITFLKVLLGFPDVLAICQPDNAGVIKIAITPEDEPNALIYYNRSYS